jgi:hypothetical protein
MAAPTGPTIQGEELDQTANPALGTGENLGINPSELTSAAASANLGGLPSIEQLTQQIDQLNINAQQAANMARIPGEAGLEAQSSANIANLLAGQVSPSTLNLLGTQAAERGVATGSPMGAGTNASYLQALGLTSEQLQGLGQQELSAATARNPGAPLMDPTTQLLTPAALGSLSNQQASLQEAYAALATRAAGGGGGGGGNPAATAAAPLDTGVPAGGAYPTTLGPGTTAPPAAAISATGAQVNPSTGMISGDQNALNNAIEQGLIPPGSTINAQGAWVDSSGEPLLSPSNVMEGAGYGPLTTNPLGPGLLPPGISSFDTGLLNTTPAGPPGNAGLDYSGNVPVGGGDYADDGG